MHCAFEETSSSVEVVSVGDDVGQRAISSAPLDAFTHSPAYSASAQ
jgi:hypothetical protein